MKQIMLIVILNIIFTSAFLILLFLIIKHFYIDISFFIYQYKLRKILKKCANHYNNNKFINLEYNKKFTNLVKNYLSNFDDSRVFIIKNIIKWITLTNPKYENINVFLKEKNHIHKIWLNNFSQIFINGTSLFDEVLLINFYKDFFQKFLWIVNLDK